jgi:hypothetical protein
MFFANFHQVVTIIEPINVMHITVFTGHALLINSVNARTYSIILTLSQCSVWIRSR